MEMSGPIDQDSLQAVPLFPLPNVVLFPRAVLPLHIFEDRYKTMTADVLAGDRLIAMALLKPGWEKNYYARPAVEPVVCVGQILTWEKLPDGKYNFLLQGRSRARIVRERAEGVYRVASLELVDETSAMEIDLEESRGRLRELFDRPRLTAMPVVRQFRELLDGSVSTSDIADLAAFNFLEDIELKQSLLAEADVRHRVEVTVAELQRWSTQINPGLMGLPVEPGMN